MEAAVNDKLRKNFESAVDGYVDKLVQAWQLEKSYGYWIGDEVGGEYAYGDFFFINLLDLIYCVENNITDSEYIEWQDYCVWAEDNHQSVPSFKSWHNGCPRCNKETMRKLVELRQQLEEAIEAAEEQLF